MSTTENPAAAAEDDLRTAPVMIEREFAAELTPGKGRTIDVRVVPYGERISHNDGKGGVPKGVDYVEQFDVGAFSEQVRAADVAGRAKKVYVNFEHGRSVLDQVGHGIALREESDGLHGTFELHDDLVGNKALLLVREGVLDGISLEARCLRNHRGADGVVRRVKAHLHGIALTRFAAYPSARVLALREEAEAVIFDEAMLPVDLDPALVERMRAQGVVLPDRYQAHPDTTGTPATAGTPEDGTRQENPS